MIIKSLNKFFASNLVRTLVIFLAMSLIVVLAVENKPNKASAQTNPEKYITDLNGQSRQSFNTGESAYLTLRGYAENLSTSSNLADIMLIIDATGSMDGTVMGTTKCAQAKSAATSFVNNVNIQFLTKVGLTTISNDPGHVFNYPLTLMDTESAKNALKVYIATITCDSGTPMGQAVNRANAELSNTAPGHGRVDAQKYIVMLSDGGENVLPALNGEWFITSRASNPNYQYQAGSSLANSISQQVKYFTILYSTATGLTCSNSDDPTELSLGCALMRYAAGKTNSIALPQDLTWMSDYGATNNSGEENGIDNQFFYKVAGEEELTNIYDRIIEYIQASSASLNFYEKLSTGVQYDEVVSIRDKGRRWVGANKIETLADGTIKFTLPKVADSYSCDAGEITCLNNSIGGVITNNYVDLKIKITFTADSKGKFDLDSNYTGCENANPVFDSARSKIEYWDPRSGGGLLGTLPMPVMCLNVLDAGAGLLMTKSTYLINQKTGEQTMQGSFQAGDEVSVRIIVNEVLPYRQNWTIKDTIPPSVTELTREPKISTPGSGNKSSLTNSINSDTLTIQNRPGDSNTALIGGVNIIEYHYKI